MLRSCIPRPAFIAACWVALSLGGLSLGGFRLATESSAKTSVAVETHVTGGSSAAATAEAAWVRELGDADFAVRTAAQQHLLDAGPAARGALSAATRDADPEVRRRAQTLLVAIEDNIRNGARRAFLANTPKFLSEAGSGGSCPMPGWDRFQKTVGDDLPARGLFVDLCRSETDLMGSLVDAQTCRQAYARRVAAEPKEIQQWGAASRPALGWQAAAAVLWIAAQGESQAPPNSTLFVFGSLPETALLRELRDARRGPPLRKLVGAWIAADHDSDCDTTRIKLRVALRFDIPRGRDLALRVVGAKLRDAEATALAMTNLAKFGSLKDAAAIEPLLADRTTFRSDQTGAGITDDKLCDVALATLAKFEGRNLADLGFGKPAHEFDGAFGANPGLVNPAVRDRALTAWKLLHEQAK
jgi:hypothetical protein